MVQGIWTIPDHRQVARLACTGPSSVTYELSAALERVEAPYK